MKILTVVGARPQFIKAAAISRKLRQHHQEILVHTGQHYDPNMSEIFFSELYIPKPDYNLGVGSGSHAQQTAQIMVKVEEVLLKEKPDYLLTYGDTNSTLAGALAAAKIHVPVIHIEAGLRSFNMAMPEEINRILTDRVSTYLFCPTDTAVENLKHEGVTHNVYNVGDVMCDAVTFYSQQMERESHEQYVERLHYLFNQHLKQEKWYLTTIHRAENTDSPAKLQVALAALEALNAQVLFPVHPRIKSMITTLYKQNEYKNIIFVEPVGYKEMLFFTKNAIKCITDSGGLQKEAYILNTPCVTMRDQTEWVETLVGNHNILAKFDKTDILHKVLDIKPDLSQKPFYYGHGDAADKIIKILDGEGK